MNNVIERIDPKSIVIQIVCVGGFQVKPFNDGCWSAVIEGDKLEWIVLITSGLILTNMTIKTLQAKLV